MKININKIFRGSTHGSQQSSLWIQIDDEKQLPLVEGFIYEDNNLNNIIRLYAFLQKSSKIIVESGYHKFEDGTIGLSYSNLEAALITLQAIEELCNGHNVESVLSELQKKLQIFSEPGQNGVFFLNDALQWRIPTWRFSNGGHFFGTGCHTQQLSSTSTKFTSVNGLNLAKNKLQTSNILSQNGLPASNPILVSNIQQAITVANQIGYPVVIKPNDRDNGDGVYANIKNDKTLRLFFEKTSVFSNNILIEKHINGFGHRITVIADKVVSTTKKIPWGITGNGVSSISQLVENLDDEMLSILEDEGLNLDSILSLGRFLPLRRKNNASASGETIGLKIEQVHPDNIQLAFTISKLFNLDIVGIDLIISDISKSWLENECVIPDVNAIPQIGFDRVKTIFESLFPGGFRVPMYLLIVDNLNDFKVEKFEKIFHINAYSTKEGVCIDGKLISNRFSNGFDSAKSMIFNSQVKSGLAVMNVEGIKYFGLPLDTFSAVIFQDVDLDDELVKILHTQNIIKIYG